MNHTKHKPVTNRSQWMMSEPEFLSTKDLMKRLGVSRKYIDRMRKYGDGPPFIKISEKMIRYPVCGYDAWIQRQLALPKASDK